MVGDAIRKLILPSCIIGAAAYGLLAPHSPLAESSRLNKKQHSPAATVHRSSTSKRAASTHVAHKAPAAPATALHKAAPSSVAGMVVARDPETGELGPPTPEQMQEITKHRAEVMRNTPEGFTEIRRADGAVGLVLNGKLQSYSVVRMGPDGKPMTECVTAASDTAALATPIFAPEER
jgi:hypothetical protein